MDLLIKQISLAIVVIETKETGITEISNELEEFRNMFIK
jgi:hypothetical protein